MTLPEIIEAYLWIGIAVTMLELAFFFPWNSVMSEVEKHLGHLGIPAVALAGVAVVGMVYAVACTVVTWPKTVYDACKKKSVDKP